MYVCFIIAKCKYYLVSPYLLMKLLILVANNAML